MNKQSRATNIAQVKNKILEGQPVSVGVFCMGNGDRSALAEQVMTKELVSRGISNVRVFSFGLSVTPAKHRGPASVRTTAYALAHGFEEIKDHQRRNVSEPDVEKDFKKADLLLGVSPSHVAYLAECYADDIPSQANHILDKSHTIKGFANNKDFHLPHDADDAEQALSRELCSRDPFYQHQTPEGNAQFNKMLDDVVADVKKAVERLSKA